jgi:hypothetical protein
MSSTQPYSELLRSALEKNMTATSLQLLQRRVPTDRVPVRPYAKLDRAGLPAWFGGAYAVQREGEAQSLAESVRNLELHVTVGDGPIMLPTDGEGLVKSLESYMRDAAPDARTAVALLITVVGRKVAACDKQLDLVTILSEFHNAFVAVRALSDGNGRFARAFVNGVLMAHRLPPVMVHEDDYVAAVKADLGDVCKRLDPMPPHVGRGGLAKHLARKLALACRDKPCWECGQMGASVCNVCRLSAFCKACSKKKGACAKSHARWCHGSIGNLGRSIGF